MRQDRYTDTPTWVDEAGYEMYTALALANKKKHCWHPGKEERILEVLLWWLRKKDTQSREKIVNTSPSSR